MIERLFMTMFLALAFCQIGLGEVESPIDWPSRPVKVIVPFGAGGGSDTFARQLIRAIEKHNLFPQPLVVINVGGAGGTIGSRRVRYARPDGYTMLMLHEGMLTARHAGKAAYGHEAFEAIAGTGKIGVVITVKEDSPLKTMKDMMEKAKNEPKSLNFAANIGAPSHFIGLMVEKALEGSMFNFVQYGGGADRYGAIIGDHVQVSIFSVEEYLRYKDGGLRALAVFSEERHPAIPDVPTAVEQNYDVVTSNMHFWWMPKGTPEGIQTIMAEAIDKAMQTEGMRAFMKTSWTEPVTLKGEDLDKELIERESRIGKVSLRKVDVLPKFEYWVGAVIVLLGIASVIRRSKQKEMEGDAAPASKLWNITSLTVYAATSVYVVILSSSVVSYPILTVVFILGMGVLIAQNKAKAVVPLALYSLGLSFGIYYLFTTVLVVDLPG